MKIIIDACMKNANDKDQNTVKLRLRGRGSGFKEGPTGQESSESLHLCVSSKYYEKFKIACSEAEKLLLSVYAEYCLFLQKKGIDEKKIFAIKTM